MLLTTAFLLFLCIGVTYNVLLSQSSSESQVYGEPVVISCEASGYDFTGYWLAWLKHVSGRELVYIGHIYPSDGDTRITDSFSLRFQLQTNNTKNTGYMKITNVQYEDAAVYYCTRWVTTEALIFGTGTRLDVRPKEQPTKAPQVFQLEAKQQASTACMAKDFYPKDIEIFVNDIKQEYISTKLSNEGFYSAVSVQNVKSNNFICKVLQPQMLVPNTTAKSKEIDYPLEEEKNNTCREETSLQSTEQINMLSFTVLGMRALFAKTLAFNLLLSAKIFIM